MRPSTKAAPTRPWVGVGIGGKLYEIAGVLPAVQERFVTAWDVVVAHNGEASGERDRESRDR